MLEAFIIDKLKRSEEQEKMEPLPIMVPTDAEYQEQRKEESKKKATVIRV